MILYKWLAINLCTRCFYSSYVLNLMKYVQIKCTIYNAAHAAYAAAFAHTKYREIANEYFRIHFVLGANTQMATSLL